MEKIIGQEFIGERPLYCKHDLYLENVKIHRGESALKETSNITAVNCVFEGKYPFWCCENFIVKNCLFTGGARAALWYSRNLEMTDTYVDAPKMFREMDGIRLKNVQIPGAAETLWHCKNIELDNVSAQYADIHTGIAEDTVTLVSQVDNLMRVCSNWRFVSHKKH